MIPVMPWRSLACSLSIGLAGSAVCVGQVPACDVLKPLTVKIDTPRELGAGFVIQINNRTAYIATALHVVAGLRSVRLSFPASSVNASVVYPRGGEESSLDLAILTAELPLQMARPQVPGMHAGAMVLGERVTFMGHPAEQNWQCYPAKEVISRLSVRGDDRQFFFTNPIALPGLSGGPISDDTGRFLGMAIGQNASSNGIGIRISTIARVLEDELGVHPTGPAGVPLNQPAGAATGPQAPPASPSATAPPKSADLRADIDGFVFELRQCSATRTSVTCKLTITSPKRDRNFRLGEWYGVSSLFDQDGAESQITGVTLANKHGGNSAETLLVRDLPVQSEITFKVTSNVTFIPLLKLRAADLDTHMPLDVQFRNIRLQP